MPVGTEGERPARCAYRIRNSGEVAGRVAQRRLRPVEAARHEAR
jgi:hypothetical protein